MKHERDFCNGYRHPVVLPRYEEPVVEHSPLLAMLFWWGCFIAGISVVIAIAKGIAWYFGV